jgi:hypothetical protein
MSNSVSMVVNTSFSLMQKVQDSFQE